ncbi:MAG: hypothetical protein ABIG64_09665 [Candidatus Omnitrophota bacterium]
MCTIYQNIQFLLRTLYVSITLLLNKLFILLQSFPFISLLIVLIFQKEIKEIIKKLIETALTRNQVVSYGNIPASEAKKKREFVNTPIRNKILNTLWTKQVNAFPGFDRVWTFKINTSSPEFIAFRDEGNTLLRNGLIGETDQGYFHLTPEGFEYCKIHHSEFGTDQWLAQEIMNKENLEKVLVKTNGVSQ